MIPKSGGQSSGELQQKLPGLLQGRTAAELSEPASWKRDYIPFSSYGNGPSFPIVKVVAR